MTQENTYHIPDDRIPDEGGYIAGHLVSALQLEDKVSRDVYHVYLDRETWPAELPEATFVEIQSLITALIEQTERHRTGFHALLKNIR